ncbi:MAG: UPF0175 family protein [Pseudomonadota bacterium]
MQSIGIRQLRERGGELEAFAQQGETILLTKNGKPLYISIPYNDLTATEGTKKALALRLFEIGVLSRGSAAKAAGISLEEFMELAGRDGIAIIDYEKGELTQELNELN